MSVSVDRAWRVALHDPLPPAHVRDAIVADLRATLHSAQRSMRLRDLLELRRATRAALERLGALE
jgi:hypothetical protein